jgi:predicted nicotinamide N-methyase
MLDRCAPFRSPELVPEISVFYAKSLVEVWEQAEKLVGEVLPSPFWAYPWAAGVGMARVILDHPAWVRGKRVLDFGCGGGIAAIAAARAQAAEVIANDVDPWALAVTRIAAQRQGLTLLTLCADLTGTPRTPAVDVIMCSDLAYEKEPAPRQRALLERVRECGARVLLADAGRTYFQTEALKPIAQFEIEVPKDLEGVDRRIARVFEML